MNIKIVEGIENLTNHIEVLVLAVRQSPDCLSFVDTARSLESNTSADWNEALAVDVNSAHDVAVHIAKAISSNPDIKIWMFHLYKFNGIAVTIGQFEPNRYHITIASKLTGIRTHEIEETATQEMVRITGEFAAV